MKLSHTITCPDDDIETIYHIQDIPGYDTSLCGLSNVTSVDHDMEEHPVNCKACIQVVKFCKNLKYEKGV